MTEDKVQQQIKQIQEFITQYNDGLITSHEMANAMARCVMDIADLAEQGCDGKPPNNILPNGERDDGMVHVG